MLALIAALLFTLPYSIGKTLGNHLIKDNVKKYAKIVPITIAILAGLSVQLGGTTHYTIYKFFFKNADYSYTDSCYYIGYKPDTNDKTITIFPSYMNIEGDLHAHHIDTIFTITMLALLLQFLLSDSKDSKGKKTINLLLMGILLGIQKMTNYWDFPIYLVIIGAVVAVKNCLQHKELKQKILTTVLQLLGIIFLQELVSFLFSKNLYISATQVYFTNITSPLYKLTILWGLPILCIIIHICVLLSEFFKEKKGNIFEYIKKMKLTDIYIIILGLCAIGLIILPEIVYLKDIYGDDYKRANTMFKLTFNAITIFHICTSYILIKLLYEKLSKSIKIRISIILLIFITTFGYGINAINYATNNLNNKTSDLKDIEGYIRQVQPDDYEAIQWIKQNIDRDAIILEKTNGSFTPSGRISVFTANSTVLGWHGHEWLWRAEPDYSAPEMLNQRWSDIFTIYTSNNRDEVMSLIEKYNISYIYIGNLEFNEINNINLNLLCDIGEIVYQDSTDYINSPVYIIKVK